MEVLSTLKIHTHSFKQTEISSSNVLQNQRISSLDLNVFSQHLPQVVMKPLVLQKSYSMIEIMIFMSNADSGRTGLHSAPIESKLQVETSIPIRS